MPIAACQKTRSGAEEVIGLLAKELIEGAGIELIQTFRKFVDVKHVGRKSLRPNPNGKTRIFRVRLKQHQADSKQHA